MADGRTLRHRETVIRRRDPRVAGFYEQALDDVDRSLLTKTLAGVIGAMAGLDVRGRLRSSSRLSFSDLRALAAPSEEEDFDHPVVRLVDLMSEMRLDVEADVLVWDVPDADSVAIPIAACLDDQSLLVLGRLGDEAIGRFYPPITLFSSQLPSGTHLPVTGLTAMTFAEFVERASCR